MKKEIQKIYFSLKFKNNKLNVNAYLIMKNKRVKQSKRLNTNKKRIFKYNQKKKSFAKNKKDKNNNFRKSTEKNDISTGKININSLRVVNSNNINLSKIMDKKDFELNYLNYKEALRFDKRNYCEYYTSLLKNNHPIIFSFFCYNDYNSNIIKFFLFFFSFSLDISVNALFFNDETMHKIYEDKGVFNILYQLPQTLYSTLISRFIDTLIKNFALSQDNIVYFKNKEKINIEKKYRILLRILKFKFFVFFIITFSILLLFWYYITCFCGIYVNTQNHLIKDSIISLIISLIIPFFLYFIPGIFRIPSLKMKKYNHDILYKFSLILQNYFG